MGLEGLWPAFIREDDKEVTDKVVVVVVTYNRLALLKSTIRAVFAQTAAVDSVVVVNNSSTDGTDEWLATQETLDVIRQQNIGGAGGFETGMKRAIEIGAKWVWVMDDDVSPRPDALETMLRFSSFSQCMMPSRLYSDGVPCEWGYIYDMKRRGTVFNTRAREQDASKEFTTINTCCFEGMLVAKELIAKIGYPDRRFFIAGDDTVYGLLASRHTNVILVRDAILIRAKTSTESKTVTPMFAYYYFRNYHLMEEYFRKLSGGGGYGWFTRLLYYREAVHHLLSARKHGLRTLWAIAKAIGRGVVDSGRRIQGRSFN